MNLQQNIEEKQKILIQELEQHEPAYAIFGIPKQIANPLIKKGILHKDTYKYTGGCTLTKLFRERESMKKWNEGRDKAEQKGLEKFNQLRTLFNT